MQMVQTRFSAILFTLLLLGAGISLLIGLYAGLIRMGMATPAELRLDGMLHGPLMINGFLGTLISLERSAALQQLWTYVAPLSFALATILLLTGATVTGGFFLIAGSVFMVIILGYLVYLQTVSHHIIMLLAGLSLLTGNLLFIVNQPIYELVIWWVGFPVLTIFGERLELNRLMRPPAKAVQLFTVVILLWLISAVLLHVDRELFWYAVCIFLIALSLWLIRYDVARRTIKSTEWTRYSALCLLSGYGWLILAGIYGIFAGFPYAGPVYDSLLHMIFVGFVFSMIFAHAAVIIPALTGLLVPYHHYFYMPFMILHISLLLRVTGDIAWIPMLQTTGSYVNVAAILLFLGGIMVQLIRNKIQGST